MVKLVLTWDLRKDIEAAKLLIDGNIKEVLLDWCGMENYERLVEQSPNDKDLPYTWVKDTYTDSLDNIVIILQQITNEIESGEIELVKRRLKAVGFLPDNKDTEL